MSLFSSLAPLLFLFTLSSGSPSLQLEQKFKTTLDDYLMGYSSASFDISEETIYVVNGANVGNAILKFNMEGEYLGEYPGWYNFPVDAVVGGPKGDQVLLSAIGADGDDGMLRFGMVLYNSEGEFFHGLQEAQTGLKRPYGLSKVPNSDSVAVCDWDNNRTVIMDIDWDNGVVKSIDDLYELPYPFRMMMTEDKTVFLSAVCCQPWHKDMVKMTILDLEGNFVDEVKELPNGDVIGNPVALTEDPYGNIILTDEVLGTLLFSHEGEFIDALDVQGSPKKMLFKDAKLYALQMNRLERTTMIPF